MSSLQTTSLGKHLLCAVPQLLDPNFRRSVVFMLDHSEEGALGLVVNNPLPNTVDEVVEGLGLQWSGSPEACVRLGGPVQPMRGWILHDQPSWDPAADEVLPGMWLTTSLEPVVELGHTEVGAAGSEFLFLLGYAGWAPSQLETEIAAGSWVAVPIDLEGASTPQIGVSPRWLFEADPEAMWDEALRSIGVDPGRLVAAKGGASALH